MTTKEPGDPGRSFWLCYHDRVREGEDILAWLRRGPNLDALPSKDLGAARPVTEAICSKVRSIHISLLEMGGKDGRAGELRDGIMPNLERAARNIASGAREGLGIAHWDLQMACELALKCLSQQRSGAFVETHDLFVLHDRMPGDPPPFARRELSRLPDWRTMAELRYGGGPPRTIRETFRAYRAALTIVDATAAALERPYRLGKARFHLKRRPWMDETDGAED